MKAFNNFRIKTDKTRKPSVLMFDAAYPPPVVGGKEKQAHLLAKALKEMGLDVEALSYIHNGNKSAPYEGVYVERVPNTILSLVFVFLAILKKRSRFNLLHIHTPSRIGRFAALVGWLAGYQVIFKFPNEYLLDNLRAVDRWFWRVVLSTASLFVVLENKTKARLESINVGNQRIFHVANGVCMGPLKNRSIDHNYVKLVFVGRLTAQKCCDQLIYACDLLARRGIHFHLEIVGDGPLRDELQSLVRELGHEANISFLGHQSNIFSHLTTADVLVLPSEKEGMSNVILEAISIGVPVVATDVGSVRSQVGDFGEQFLCEPYNPDCLADKIERLVKNPQLYLEFGQYLNTRGHKIFSMDTVASQYVEKYFELLKKNDSNRSH